MPLDQEIVGKIRDVLQKAPDGLFVTQISQKIGANRNVAAKYLDILETNGQVESQVFGTARVFFLPRRLPVSAILGLSEDLICTIDTANRLTYANDRFLDFFHLDPGTLYSQHTSEIQSVPDNGKSLAELLGIVPGSPDTIRVMPLDRNGKRIYLRVKTTTMKFEDGTPGKTLVMEDVTSEKEHLNNLEFLARTSATLADMGDDDNIYQYIVDRIVDLEPKCHVTINSIDAGLKITVLRALAGDERLTEGMFHYFGDLRGVQIPMDFGPEAWEPLSRGTIEVGPERLFEQAFRILPEAACDEFQEKVSLKRSYAMGCTCRGGLYGNITLRYMGENDLCNRETVEAFVRQAGVALQRRHMKEKLRQAEKRIRELEGVSEE